jgi:hypothetical protein
VFTIDRIECSGSTGLDVHDQTESVFTIHRNTQEMFDAVRSARLPGSSMLPEEFNDPVKRGNAVNEIRRILLDNARDAWRRFQDHYALARLYIDPSKAHQPNVANEVYGCIRSLEGFALSMRFSEQGGDDFEKAWHAFRGSLTQEPDDIEKRLLEPEKAWQAELQSIILLAKAKESAAATLARLRAAWRGIANADR